MASIQIAETMTAYGPRFLAVAVPWLFVRWRRSHVRPILWVERTSDSVSVTTTNATPIRELALRFYSDDDVFSETTVSVTDEAFTEARVSRPAKNEVRVTTKQFSCRDRILFEYKRSVEVEVLCSAAVPVAGRPTKLVRGVDYVIGLLAVFTLLMVVAEPLRTFLVPNTMQQSQDGANLEFEDLVTATAVALLLIASYIGGAVLLVPARRAVFFGRKALAVLS